MSSVIALDIGGSKIRAGLVNRSGDILLTQQRTTDTGEARASILASLDAAIADIMSQMQPDAASPQAIGISTAGVVDPASGQVTDATPNLPGWSGVPLGAYLAERWQLPAKVENDGKCAMLGELWRNPALRTGLGVLLTLGTGLGGAIVVDGTILAGATNRTGHFGMVPLADAGGEMTVETHVSGHGLTRLANADFSGPNGEFSNSQAVLAAAEAGDARACSGLDMWLDALARTIEGIAWSLDPHWLLLGGGMVEARRSWWDKLEAKVDSRGLRLRPQPALLGNDAGMVGAAWLAHTAHARDGQ